MQLSYSLDRVFERLREYSTSYPLKTHRLSFPKRSSCGRSSPICSIFLLFRLQTNISYHCTSSISISYYRQKCKFNFYIIRNIFADTGKHIHFSSTKSLQKTVKNALKIKSDNERGTMPKHSKKPELSDKRAVRTPIFRQFGLLNINDCGNVHLQSFRRQIQLTFTTNKNMTIMQRRGLRPDISKVYLHLTGNILLPVIFLRVFYRQIFFLYPIC